MTELPADLSLIESDEGWPYASSIPVATGDPGRFHALFGRDALITSLQLLPARPQMAHATVRALAARQGREANPRTQEEPGKIGHEFRPSPPQSFLDAGWPDPGTFRYYGSADATSWFCVVLASDARRAASPRARGRMARGGRLDRPHSRLRRRAAASQPGVVSRRPQPARLARHDRSHAPGRRRRAARRRYPPAAAARRRGYASRDRSALRALAALSGDDVWRQRARGAQGATVQGLRSRRGRAGGRRSGGSRCRVAARMAAVGRCARADRGARGGRPALRTGHSHRRGASHLGRDGDVLRGTRLPSRLDLAIRLVAGLGWAARGWTRCRGRARTRRRTVGSRPARARARAVCRHAEGGSRARSNGQLGAGLDGRRVLGARGGVDGRCPPSPGLTGRRRPPIAPKRRRQPRPLDRWCRPRSAVRAP